MPDTPNFAKRTHPGSRSAKTPAGPATPAESPPSDSPDRPAGGRRRSRRYAEVRCQSNFSFLRGASHPEELVEQAAALGYDALAVTDHNTLAGVVRMHCAAKNAGLKLLVGAEITPIDAPPITLYATDRAAYGSLCRIITQGRLRTKKGDCRPTFADIAQWHEGLIGAVHVGEGTKGHRDGGTKAREKEAKPAADGKMSIDDCQLSNVDCRSGDLDHVLSIDNRESPNGNTSSLRRFAAPSLPSLDPSIPLRAPSSVALSLDPSSPSLRSCVPSSPFPSSLRRFVAPSLPSCLASYHDLFADRLYLTVGLHGGSDDARILAEAREISRTMGVPLLASNDVHYHEPRRRFLQDVLTCVREHCTLEEAGRRLFANAERYLKPLDEMERLFADEPRAMARTLELADRCRFSLDELRYEYPEALCPPDRTPQDYLAELTWRGARTRYPAGVPDRIRSLIEHELQLIRQLQYEPYFLTVWDIVNFARSQNILCQGRGSAANSAVCYCLDITSVDPDRIDLLFERFVSAERNEPPDIDVDFEHERREEVFQYIYNKYGRDHAGIVAEVITYRPRSAIRDVGKTLGLSLDHIDVLAKKHEWWDRDILREDFLRETGLDPSDRTLRMLRKLSQQLVGFPRHLSQHVGGFVITRGPLCELVPIENGAMPDRTFIEWDKDDIDALGMLKIDCLALGMLTAIHKCMRMLNESDEATKRRSDEEIQRVSIEEEATRSGEWSRGEVCIEAIVNQNRRAQAKNGSGSRCGSDSNIGDTVRACKTPHGTADGAYKSGNDNQGDKYACKDISRSDRMAKGNGPGQRNISGDKSAAGRGTVWPDRPDAACGSRDSIQHRRGAWAREPDGLPAVPANGAWIVDGTPDTTASLGTPVSSDFNRRVRRAVGGSGSRSARSDSRASANKQLSEEGERAEEPGHDVIECRSRILSPPSLRRFVASSLSSPSSLVDVPPEDPAVYDMICRADTVGVFQIESRAQMTMLPRLRPRCFYDLVIEVAIVRPGPIQGGMVHPYLRRRSGQEPVTYPSDAVRDVLKRTLGVPLFQEQAMKLAVVAAGFTPGEADQLRRAMGAWRKSGDINRFRTKLIDGMKRNGLSEEFAQRCFEQISGFGEYGFPESHAASFALLVYVSAWLKRYYPAAFCASILNSQPMGFYQPAQLVRDAREHGVTVLPIDVNDSGYDCRLESSPPSLRPSVPLSLPESWGLHGPALRLGMRLIRGISAAQVEGIERAQADRPFTSVTDLIYRSGAARATLARLAAADAMRSFGLNRREAVWAVLAMGDEPPLFEGVETAEPPPALPEATIEEIVLQDYDVIGLSLNAHPIGLIRKDLHRMGVQPTRALRNGKHGKRLRIAGLVLVRQRPSTAKGIVFATLEDETGVANLIIPPDVYDRYRSVAHAAVALVAEGITQRVGEVSHLKVTRVLDLTRRPSVRRTLSRDFH